MKYTILVVILFTQSAFAHTSTVDCDKHPIYCHIINNHPTIKRAYAFELSNAIYKASVKYKLDAKLMSAIFAQESMYSIDKKNCTTGLAAQDDDTHEKIQVCTDFGIGQIWYKTADSYDFDITKLTTDMEYSVDAAAIVLKDFKNRYHKREQFWWTRYNATTPSKRKKYRELVENYIDAY